MQDRRNDADIHQMAGIKEEALPGHPARIENIRVDK